MTLTDEKFKPLISIIIPVYNGANFIKEAINSALAQTYKNTEIIVVNDGSTDNSEDIIKSYGNKLAYLKKENGGVATALNLAIEKSKGEYISWLSHDDVYFPYKLEKQIKILENLVPSERNKTILYSDYILIDKNSKNIGQTQFSSLHNREKLNLSLYPLFNGLIHGCTLLIPKKCFEEIGGFNPELKTTQDYDLWYRMFPHYKIKYISDYLVKSRIHENQGSKLIIAPQECDALWINMLEQLEPKDIYLMSGGLVQFYQNILKVITAAGYTGAVSYVNKKLDKYKQRNIDEILVSVIIPFNNRIDYTIESINSVLNQTHKNLELILIDDGSTENTNKIQNIVNKNKNIKLFRNNYQKGAAASRNSGIKKANGEFIAFLDSDDIFMPNKISIQLKFMLENLSIVTHTSYTLFSENSNNSILMSAGTHDYFFPETINDCEIATPTIMIHKDVFWDQNNLFPEEYTIGEDICLWIRLSKTYTIRGINKPLTKVRQHKNRTLDNPTRLTQGVSNILHYTIKYFLDEKSYESIITLIDSLNSQVRLLYSNQTLRTIEQNNKKSSYKFSQIKYLIKKLLLLFPIYRKVQTLENLVDTNSLLISELLQKIQMEQVKYEGKLTEIYDQILDSKD